jgi:OOP family OmpA-OmpF porin
MDSQKLVCFALLASMTSVSYADGFFINTSLGASNYYSEYPLNPAFEVHHSHTEALRFGYRWATGPISYGFETGYANLGQGDQWQPGNFNWSQYRERIDGFMLGPSLRYSLPLGFYISAHAGAFRSTDHQTYKFSYSEPLNGGAYNNYYVSDRVSNSTTGTYVGVGVGYDVSKSLSLGVNYDTYRMHAMTNNAYFYTSSFVTSPRVDAYTVTAEYRF